MRVSQRNTPDGIDTEVLNYSKPFERIMTGSAVAPALRIPDYELLQLVGRGSYGEVWMAHNALGSLRAVKVVWRKNFEDERPYEREFRGIRKFEPVSRKHEGLIDLYHVGRNNDEGYFYYAMELADDAAPVIASEGEYRPRTLREELRARGRLTIDKAMEIGIKLASALEHLHRAGLIHRDIKPSNIIFVDGAPKLADIGLVAGISDARSFVGTEGFVPPEGPGTPAADIFSLGKVLYETSTGLDRNDFPKLPPLGADSGIDPGQFSEFNAVLLKACEPSPQSRYRTVEELLNDLLWIREGKSICRLRAWQRRKALLWKTGAAAVGVGILGWFLAASRYQRPAHGQFEKSELQKVEELFEKDDANGALASLARIVRSNPNDRPAAERLMAALTWRNFMVPSVEPIAVESRPRFISFSPDGEEVALALSNGTLQFRDAATGERTWEEQASEDGVTAMAWSPDRIHLIITGQRSGRIYDALSRQSVVEGLAHDSRIVSVQFSPQFSRGQPWILTGASSGTAQVWDAHDARPVEKTFAHDGPIRQAMFSPDGRHVATAGLGDGAIRIWDFATMQPTSPLLRHGRAINAMAFSRYGHRLVTASDDGTAQIWRMPEGSLHTRVIHQGPVSDVAFSPDGSKLATASENGMAILWDLETGKPIGKSMRHRAAVRKVQFSPDGLKFVTLSEDCSVRVWDATTAEPLSETIRHPRAVVENLAFSPTGERMATAGQSATDGSLWLWKTTPRGALSRPFKISGNKRSAHLVRQTGQLCIADGQSLRLWANIDSAEEPAIIDLSVPVDFFKLAPDGTLCVAVSANNAWVWDLSSRQPIMGPLWHATEILGAEFSPDHSHLAVATAGGHLMLWQVEGATDQPRFHQFLPLPAAAQPTGDDGTVAVNFSPDGRLVLAACRNGKARIFDARTAELLVDLPHKHWVLSAEFSPDGRRIITASYDRYAQVWNTATGQPVGQPLHHDNDVLTGRFSPDGRRVITTSRDWTARVWDAQTGRPVSEPLRHSGPVLTACFGPDGVRVATGSADETARIWDAEIGQPLTDPFRYSGPVQHVEFTPDGSRLLVVPATGDVQLIDVLQVRLPAPSWLPALAEAVARQHLNERQMTEPVPAEQFFRLKEELNSLPDSPLSVHWAKWFMADPAQRTISPNSTIGLRAYRDGLLRAGTKAALRRAIRLDPTDALAHARLAQLLISPEQTAPPPRDISEARWHERYARKLQPESRDISRLCDIVESRISALNLPTASPPESR